MESSQPKFHYCRIQYICDGTNETPDVPTQEIPEEESPIETNQVQANTAPANPADAPQIQLPPQENADQANIPLFEGNVETRVNTIQAPPALPGQENSKIPENPSTVLDILGPQQEDVKNKIAPEAPQQVLGPQDFYIPSSQDSLDVYKYYPYTTIHRT